MKKKYRSIRVSILIIMPLLLSFPVFANWTGDTKADTKTVTGSGSVSSENNKSDTLPEGVTQNWLNSLTDEKGNKIAPEEDPEGDSFQRKTFNGLSASSRFGFAVNTAGDVNGDGFDDVIIGSYLYSSGIGRAYIYYGGLIMNTVADIIITGLGSGYNFGYSVSTAGDVNGDGYSDVIIGAPGYSTNTGRAYIYFGGLNMNTGTFLTLSGEAAGNFFGGSVSSAGDVNGDGYSDVIAGAYGYSSNTGRAYVYYGGASMNNVVDVTITGAAINYNLGFSVSNAGDFNGDGYSDVIAGASGYNTSTGRAYVYYGGASMDNVADVTMTGAAINYNFGYSVAFAGDVNGDGYSDVISGATGYSTNRGRAYVYYGGSSPDNTADVTVTGEASGNFFGNSVSTAGDMNGDGFSDIVVGAQSNTSNTGKAYIYFGGVSMNNVADAVITGEGTNNYLGYSVSYAGDVNGDGYSEVIAGAWGYGSNTGRAYVYDYYMKGDITSDLSMTGEATNNQFGYSVSSAGDVNGDGFSDVIVGAYSYSLSTGRAYIYFGGASMDNVADVTMSGGTTGNEFGKSVSSAGDVNGDGYGDVIVGARAYSSNTGRAYIYFGGSSMNNVADVTMTGPGAGGDFGISVSSAGDVNGDGYSDVIAGASEFSGRTGRAYIYLGGASMDNIADVIVTGEATNNQFGYSVSDAGDVNGDGFSDVIVGAFEYSGYTGRAYLYFGGVSMDNSADLTMTGASTINFFGGCVSDAGDVNGDGYSDVIVGSYGNSSYIGRANIYYGGASMDIIADVTLTGAATNNYFGGTVSAAGDVNADGYSDVIISANGYSNTGRAYVFYGGASMDNTADMTMTGEIANNGFAVSVTSAGDVNADGYSDVMVGAYAYSSNTGQSFIYLGSAISAKPILQSVKDVPNDQGGKVNLKWSRSGYDVNNINRVISYSVLRSFPPSNGNFYWTEVANVTAQKFSFYSYIDNTPYDSTSNNSGTFFYRIKANTNNSSEYWLSGILSGRSIDNIAPLMVSPFTAIKAGTNVNLNWGSSSAPDILNYILFRSTSSVIDPYTATPLSIVNTNAYIDTSPLSGLSYYFIVAQDIHGNFSPVASTTIPYSTINLTFFIEGFYRPSLNTQIIDTVRTYLRNTSSPYAIVDSATAALSITARGKLNFLNASAGSYYLSVRHRNSIETWSASVITIATGGTVNYDFSTAKSQAYGNNMIQIDTSPVNFGVYSGDENQDGFVNLTDVVNVYNNSAAFVNGYVSSDMNGDNLTDLTDVVITSNNAGAFVSKIVP